MLRVYPMDDKRRSYAIRPETCQFLNNLWSSSLSFNAHRRRRIYVGRGAALQGRHLKNDEELTKALGGLSSITPVTMDGLSLSEQANICYNADLIVAPQGAALTNIVFCRPGTKVVEIQKPNFINDAINEIANVAGVFLTSLIGEDDPRYGLRPNMTYWERIAVQRSDFMIDIDEVIAAVDAPAMVREGLCDPNLERPRSLAAEPHRCSSPRSCFQWSLSTDPLRHVGSVKRPKPLQHARGQMRGDRPAGEERADADRQNQLCRVGIARICAAGLTRP